MHGGLSNHSWGSLFMGLTSRARWGASETPLMSSRRQSQRRALSYLTTPRQHTRAHTTIAERAHPRARSMHTCAHSLHTCTHVYTHSVCTCTRKVSLFQWCPSLRGAQRGPEQSMGGRNLAPLGLRWDAQIGGQGDPEPGLHVWTALPTPRGAHTTPPAPGMLQALHWGLGLYSQEAPPGLPGSHPE